MSPILGESEEPQLSDGREMIVEGVGGGVGEEVMEPEECVRAIEEEQVSYCEVMDESDPLLGRFEPAGGEWFPRTAYLPQVQKRYFMTSG